ncbi:MAG TPA: fumarylacetoacetate hydrolase family protein [Candidatus Agrococcus pullicola]|uniref:Fumarylacetoacetate hydrolase family protein n=1 Tax=Candidatus Agrococcus pullicola TaxID=2838429 RepID=A0A9D1YWD5_9MICO|nr:fumarylacetoacetate hydrolase family protein [Candidatus Agrococcus pullicola]
MQIARFSLEGGAIGFGIVDEDELVVLSGDPMFAGFDTTGERVELGDARLLAPVIPRSKVVGIGRNYRDHAAELGNEVPDEPLVFLKPNTAVIGPEDAIPYPSQTDDLQYEGEVALVIGKVARNVSAASAADVVFGVTAANDVTMRDRQRSDKQWARAKGFDASCPLGPVIQTEFDPEEIRVQTRLDGKTVQDGTTADLVFDFATLIEYVSSFMTLLPGDVILTGTPAGVGPMQAGQTVEVEVEGVGTLTNRIVGQQQ